MLAGGRASRLGGVNKALLKVEGTTVINRILKVIRPMFHEVILAGWNPEDGLPEGVRYVPDNYKGIGPLGGIEAAMKAASTPYLFVFAGDMPWLSGEIITCQVSEFYSRTCEVMVTRTGTRIHPLHSVFSVSLHASLEAYIRSGVNPAVKDFTRLCHVCFFDLPDDEETRKGFSGLNTPDDL